MKNHHTVGERLRVARKRAGLTQAQLAKKIGHSRGGISQCETRTNKSLSAEKLLRAAKVLRVNPFWLGLGEGRVEDYGGIADLICEMPDEEREHLLSYIRFRLSETRQRWGERALYYLDMIERLAHELRAAKDEGGH